MKKVKPKKKEVKDEIEHLLEKMKDLDPNTEEYDCAVRNLKTLVEAETISKPKIDWNVVISGCVNILGIGILVSHEFLGNVISSKAINQLWKTDRR